MIPARSRPHRTVAFALLAAALVINPWVIGYLFTTDGAISQINPFAALLLCMLLCLLGGVQLLFRWVEPLAWGKPVGWLRGSVFVTTVAFLLTTIYWGVEQFNRGHSHTIVIPSDLAKATPAQRQWAEDFYQRSLAAARAHGWFDIDKAMQQGFQVDRINRTHFPNLEYMFDDVILDPERPEWLVYHDSPAGKVLMALMFFTRELEEIGPTPAGPLAQWHYHPYEKTRCAVKGLWTVGDADDDGACTEGVAVTRTPEMFHVWFIDHPLGRFTEMKIVPEYWQESSFDIKLWHPVAVHFAIALFVISVLLDVAGRLTKRRHYHQAAWLNLVVATIAAIITVGLGLTAEVFLQPTAEGHATLNVHKLLGFASLAAIIGLFAWRYLLRGEFPHKGALLYIVFGLTGVATISGAGYYGGEMVYRHGAAVQVIDQITRSRYWRDVREIYRAPALTAAGLEQTP